MAYPFVQAANDYGLRKGPFLAFVVHMAEGGGTVGFLSRPNQRGVSVHYVIEYSGRIVQMLLESHASGSINPKELRTDDGPAPYGASVGKAVLGDWWKDPNSAVIAVEEEGFAATGPNPKQDVALYELVNDVRSRHPDIGLLGHRDFQNYKACPGAHILWEQLGGHGPASTPGGDVAISTRGLTLVSDHAINLPAGTKIYQSPAAAATVLGTADGTVDYYGTPATGWKAVRCNPDGKGSVIAYTSTAATPYVVPLPTPPGQPVTYPVTVGGKDAGTVTLP